MIKIYSCFKLSAILNFVLLLLISCSSTGNINFLLEDSGLEEGNGLVIFSYNQNFTGNPDGPEGVEEDVIIQILDEEKQLLYALFDNGEKYLTLREGFYSIYRAIITQTIYIDQSELEPYERSLTGNRYETRRIALPFPYNRIEVKSNQILYIGDIFSEVTLEENDQIAFSVRARENQETVINFINSHPKYKDFPVEVVLPFDVTSIPFAYY